MYDGFILHHKYNDAFIETHQLEHMIINILKNMREDINMVEFDKHKDFLIQIIKLNKFNYLFNNVHDIR